MNSFRVIFEIFYLFRNFNTHIYCYSQLIKYEFWNSDYLQSDDPATKSFRWACLPRSKLMNFLRSDNNLRRCVSHCLIPIDDRLGNSRSPAQVPPYIIPGLFCLARPVPGLIAPWALYIISAKLRVSATPRFPPCVPSRKLGTRVLLLLDLKIDI